MAQKELILKDNYICRKALMQNHDLEIQDINGEVTMTAGDPEKTDNTRVSAAYMLLVFVPVFLEIWWMKGQEKLHKRIVCWRPLEVGVLTSGKSWIRHCISAFSQARGCLCLEGLCPGGSLSRAVSVRKTPSPLWTD